ncbi:hypothetical protein GCM10023200_31480 [Actinomycetospora chlora]|uniref:Uncharacterized protein n=1 Tax=Actinomycetospora chlora TaxID=663608 RepID=A0ABP9BFH2_9PSEU
MTTAMRWNYLLSATRRVTGPGGCRGGPGRAAALVPSVNLARNPPLGGTARTRQRRTVAALGRAREVGPSIPP